MRSGQSLDLGSMKPLGFSFWECLFRPVGIASWPNQSADVNRVCGRAVTITQCGHKTGIVLIDLKPPESRLSDAFLVGSPGIGHDEHGEAVTLTHVDIFSMNLLQDGGGLGVVNQGGVSQAGVEADCRMPS